MDLLMRLIAMALLGYLFAYGEPATQLGLLVAIGIAARQSESSVVLLFAFYAVALSPAATAAFDYSASVQLAALAWAVPVTLNVLTLGWTLGTKRHTALWSVGMLTLLSIAPLSAYAVISIWPLAGLLFPGTGWWGIALISAIAYGLIGWRADHRQAASTTGMALIAMLVLSTNAHAAVTQVRTSHPTVGIDTQRGMPDESKQALFSQAWRFEELDEAERHVADTVVFPESTFGEWNGQSQAILASSSRRILGGARQWLDEAHYVNVLIDARDGQILYRQRFPVPAVLGGTAKAVSTPTDTDSPMAALLCVELANTGLAASTYAAARETVIWAANLGWSKRSTLYQRLVDETWLWSRLFDVRTIITVNHPEASHA